MSPIQILGFLFDFYISIVLLRLLLQFTRADFYNPLSQFCVRLTQPVLAPLRRLIPSAGGLDTASFVFALLLIALKEALLGRLYFGVWLDLLGLLQRSAFGLIFAILQLMLMLVFARAILSWVDPHGQSPFYRVLNQLTEPLLRPIRRVVPDIGGLDLSPMFAILLIFFAQWLVGQLLGFFH